MALIQKNLSLQDYLHGTAGAVVGGSKSFCTEGYEGALEGAQYYGKMGWDIGKQCGEKAGSEVGKAVGGEIGHMVGIVIGKMCESTLAYTVGVRVPGASEAGGMIGRQIGSNIGNSGGARYYAGGVVGAGVGGLSGAVVCGTKRGLSAVPEGVNTGWQKAIEYSRGGKKNSLS